MTINLSKSKDYEFQHGIIPAMDKWALSAYRLEDETDSEFKKRVNRLNDTMKYHPTVEGESKE